MLQNGTTWTRWVAMWQMTCQRCIMNVSTVHYLYAFKRLYLPQNGWPETTIIAAAATATGTATAAGACENMPTNNVAR